MSHRHPSNKYNGDSDRRDYSNSGSSAFNDNFNRRDSSNSRAPAFNSNSYRHGNSNLGSSPLNNNSYRRNYSNSEAPPTSNRNSFQRDHSWKQDKDRAVSRVGGNNNGDQRITARPPPQKFTPSETRGCVERRDVDYSHERNKQSGTVRDRGLAAGMPPPPPDRGSPAHRVTFSLCASCGYNVKCCCCKNKRVAVTGDASERNCDNILMSVAHSRILKNDSVTMPSSGMKTNRCTTSTVSTNPLGSSANKSPIGSSTGTAPYSDGITLLKGLATTVSIGALSTSTPIASSFKRTSHKRKDLGSSPTPSPVASYPTKASHGSQPPSNSFATSTTKPDTPIASSSTCTLSKRKVSGSSPTPSPVASSPTKASHGSQTPSDSFATYTTESALNMFFKTTTTCYSLPIVNSIMPPPPLKNIPTKISRKQTKKSRKQSDKNADPPTLRRILKKRAREQAHKRFELSKYAPSVNPPAPMNNVMIPPPPLPAQNLGKKSRIPTARINRLESSINAPSVNPPAPMNNAMMPPPPLPAQNLRKRSRIPTDRINHFESSINVPPVNPPVPMMSTPPSSEKNLGKRARVPTDRYTDSSWIALVKTSGQANTTMLPPSNPAQVSRGKRPRTQKDRDIDSTKTVLTGCNLQVERNLTPPLVSDELSSNSIKNNTFDSKINVIFCIDQSRSMEKMDVKQSGGNVSRWDAVFTCASEFVREQMKTQNGENNGIIEEPVIDRDVEFSLILFNDTATLHFKKKDPLSALDCIEQVRKANKPKLGTNNSAAWEKVEEVCRKDKRSWVIFLSDGRPSGLPGQSFSGYIHQKLQVSKEHKKGKEKGKLGLFSLEEIVNKHKSVLHFICIHKDGKAWMQELAKYFKGTFHMPSSSLDTRESDLNSVPAKYPLGISVRPKSVAKYREVEVQVNDSAEVEDTELYVLGSKSAETLRIESFQMAQARQSIVDIHDGPTTIRDTFLSISTALTTIRQPKRQGNLQERLSSILLQSTLARGGSTEGSTSTYPATMMVLDETESKFVVPHDEIRDGRTVHISTMPFAQGGLRTVFYMHEVGSSKSLVAKESRHILAYSDRLRFHLETYKCHLRAMKASKKFNKKLKIYYKEQKKKNCPKTKFLKPAIYRLKDVDCAGGFRYLAIEEKLNGKYDKFNSNNGFVKEAANENEKRLTEVAQSFSHFSHVFSKGTEIVVDIQGKDFEYTDPQIHSLSIEYGMADRGKRGIKDFFRTHKCNSYCKVLNLTPYTKVKTEVPANDVIDLT